MVNHVDSTRFLVSKEGGQYAFPKKLLPHRLVLVVTSYEDDLGAVCGPAIDFFLHSHSQGGINASKGIKEVSQYYDVVGLLLLYLAT